MASLFLLTITAWQLLLFGLVIWGLLEHSIDWATAEEVSATLQNIATVAALIVGGVWTYFLFIKGRVFKSRLQLEVVGEIIDINSKKYIRILVELKNVGSSKVEITREGFGLDIFAQRPSPTLLPEDCNKYKVRGISWEPLLPFYVLTRHAWIEPGETIRDQLLAEILISESIAYKVDFVIFASGMRWMATSIVSPQPKTQLTDNSFCQREDGT